jgi:hypothetical protein
MTEPDPAYTATLPGAVVKPEPPRLPAWARAYLMERRRALLTELRAIEAELGIKSKN